MAAKSFAKRSLKSGAYAKFQLSSKPTSEYSEVGLLSFVFTRKVFCASIIGH